MSEAERVTGIGGVFLRSEDPEALGNWYRERLGIPVNEHGYCDFEWRTLTDPERVGRTVWSLFPSDTDYFGPGSRQFMVNYRVADLDALVAALREEGVDLVDGIEAYDYGRFAWIQDPEGNRIELWEPPTGEADAEPSREDERGKEDGTSLRRSVLVAASPDRAFQLFTEGVGAWWPSEYTWSGSVLETIAMEPGVGGRCFETGPEGFECDWGRILEWDPPQRVVFTWQISPSRVPEPDPTRASKVEVTFREEEQGTRIVVEHRDFHRHGAGAEAYRGAMASDRGWPLLLDRFAAAFQG